MNAIAELLDMLRDVPPSLALAWGGWLAVGVALVIWQVKARAAARLEAIRQAEARRARPKSGVRPPSVRLPKPAPVDAFGELEALLEPAADSGSLSRRPGD